MRARCFRFRSAVFTAFAAAMLWSATALGASVSFRAPAVCPSQSEVLERLAAARGGPLGDESNISFTASVVQKAHGRLTLTVDAPADVTSGDSSQTRVVQATECEELVAALVQMVSLALGPAVAPPSPAAEVPTAGAAPSKPTSAAPSKPTSAVPVAHAAQDEDEPDSAVSLPQRREKARIALLAVLDTASLGGASFGAEFAGGVSLGSVFELRGAVGYLPPHTVTGLTNDDEAGGRLSLAFAAVLGCAAWADAAWRLPLCAGLEGGSLGAYGTGVSQPESDTVGWLAVRAEALLGFELGRGVRATVFGGMVAPLVRHEFSVAGESLLRLPAVSARVGLGLESAL